MSKNKNDSVVDVMVSFTLPKDIHDLVDKVSSERGENKSSFMRRAIYTLLAKMSYLSNEQKKALGVNNGEKE